MKLKERTKKRKWKHQQKKEQCKHTPCLDFFAYQLLGDRSTCIALNNNLSSLRCSSNRVGSNVLHFDSSDHTANPTSSLQVSMNQCNSTLELSQTKCRGISGATPLYTNSTSLNFFHGALFSTIKIPAPRISRCYRLAPVDCYLSSSVTAKLAARSFLSSPCTDSTDFCHLQRRFNLLIWL